MGSTLVTGPVREPLTLGEAKDHLKPVDDVEDSFIEPLIAMTRRVAETYTKRAFMTQTWDLALDRFPRGAGEILLPRPPLLSVVQVSYTDPNGDPQVLPGANYEVDVMNEPGRVRPVEGVVWPSTKRAYNAAVVRYSAGFGPLERDVPDELRHALKLLMGHYYEHREAVTMGNVQELPRGFVWLLQPWRVDVYG